MKTKFILFFLMLFSATIFAQEVKRVAILETVDKEDQVAYAYEALLRRNLSKAITNISGYEVYDRTDIDAIMSEQSFQRTGLVSNDQIKRLGEMTGASYILVAEVAMAKEDVLIFAKLLDVETARIIIDDLETTTLDNIQGACEKLAKRMFHEEVKEEVKIVHHDTLIRHTKHQQKWLGVEKYTYGKTQMDERAFRKFMQQNNRQAYIKYMQGEKIIQAGWGTLLGGLIMGSIGVGCYVYHKDRYYYYDDKWDEKYKYDYYNSSKYDDPLYKKKMKNWHIAEGGGGTLIGVGYGISVFAGIPLLSVGYTRQKKAINMFNEQNGQQPAVTLSVQASQNGIGLALNF